MYSQGRCGLGKSGIDLILKKLALIGNPNCGKSTLFNLLTGLNQKVGNFPGVTVDKLSGNCKIEGEDYSVIDFPGTFSINPKSPDEEVVFSVLSQPTHPDFPDLVLLIADASNLKRSLFIATQVIELGLPALLVLNMTDVAEKNGIETNVELLGNLLGISVVKISARNQTGISELNKAIASKGFSSSKTFVNLKLIDNGLSGRVMELNHFQNEYAAFHYLNHFSEKGNKTEEEQEIEQLIVSERYDAKLMQRQEAILRYRAVNDVFTQTTKAKPVLKSSISEKLDNVLTHKFWGLLIFAVLLFLIFQTVFNLSRLPMEGIDTSMSILRSIVSHALSPGLFTNLLVEGVLGGLTGIVIFIPQIALLFGLISILEESGYMARVSFLMDKLMRPFGLNGRSVIPLIGGIACAVPSILAARTIGSRKERLLTILVTPLMSCSARLPVYSLMISIVIPQGYFLGFIGYQGLVLLFLYFLGLIAALVVAAILNFIIKNDVRRHLFVFEMPEYRLPRLKAVGITVGNKIKDFLTEAGGVIMAIAIVLWALATFGPETNFRNIEQKYTVQVQTNQLDSATAIANIKAEKLEASFAGIMGKSIEPILKPLGFDWKIGIALITSFAAREVFVGTMNTIYSVSDSDTDQKLLERMKSELRPGTNKPLFDLATGFSLMLFYAFAMQCMSTLAVVKTETKSWKWPAIQFLYMGALAYLASFVAYSVLK